MDKDSVCREEYLSDGAVKVGEETSCEQLQGGNLAGGEDQIRSFVL